MKKKTERKGGGNSLTVFLMFLVLCFASSCKDDKVDSQTHDPSQPIEITEFTPKNGAARTRLFIYGKNFGTDLSLIHVTIGGLKAKVIGCNGECIYCVVPQRAFEGTIEVSIGAEGSTPAVVESPEKFKYERKTMVSTLCGDVSETGEFKVTDGPFENAGFNSVSWLSFDPLNFKHLYAVEEYASIRLIDLEEQEVSTTITTGQMSIGRPRTISWYPDKNTMLVCNDQGSEDGISNVAMTRDESFLRAEIVTRSRSCNGSTVQPVNGELYFSQWEGGSIWRYDPKSDEPRQELFKVWANGYEIGIVFHPTGNYAYLIVHNNQCIVKSNYNWKEKKLEVPQPFVGNYGDAGWVDGVGTAARFNTPWQGVFVKNEEYEKQGRSDIYDFYVCDRNNHCIRKVTPEGMVTTYAGRGSEGLDSKPEGYIDGDLRKETRFNEPCGIAYDESTKTFYIADFKNHRIRSIVVEEETTGGESGEGDKE